MPATMRQIGEIISSGELDDCAKWVVMWQFQLLGDFEAALAQAICKADDGNLMALSLGFPVQVMAYRQWTRGDLGKRLRAMGLEV